MDDPPKWPAYEIGPRESVFALGVASVNYARLEFVFRLLFSTVTETPLDLTNALFMKLGNDGRTDLIERALPSRHWPEPANDYVRHFVAGFRKCAENRNHLMHSDVDERGDTSLTLLSKLNKRGVRIISITDLNELRTVADDMRAYSDFGLAVSRSIYAEIFGSALARADGFVPWPSKPAEPHCLHYEPP
jgi:hypothetical protein